MLNFWSETVFGIGVAMAGFGLAVLIVAWRRYASTTITSEVWKGIQLIRCVWCQGSLKAGRERFSLGRNNQEFRGSWRSAFRDVVHAQMADSTPGRSGRTARSLP